jgi:hypothetical protein
MFNLSKKAAALTKQLFKGNEVENKIAAGVLRTILSDITRLYFENKKVKGKGILVFNPEDPEKSRYITTSDLEDDIAVAQEAMNEQFSDSLQKIVKLVEKESDSDLALIAMIQPGGIAIHMVDSKEANQRIDELANGLIF